MRFRWYREPVKPVNLVTQEAGSFMGYEWAGGMPLAQPSEPEIINLSEYDGWVLQVKVGNGRWVTIPKVNNEFGDGVGA